MLSRRDGFTLYGKLVVDFFSISALSHPNTTIRLRLIRARPNFFPIDNFKDHYVLVFDLTSMQDSTEKYYYPELVGEPLKLKLNFTFPLEHVTELIVL